MVRYRDGSGLLQRCSELFKVLQKEPCGAVPCRSEIALRGLQGLMRPLLSERLAWDRSADSAWCQGCSKHARAREDDTRHRHTDTTTHTDRDRDRETQA